MRSKPTGILQAPISTVEKFCSNYTMSEGCWLWKGQMYKTGYGGKSKTWYEANKDKMQLHPATRKWVEKNVSDSFLAAPKSNVGDNTNESN